MQVEYINPFVQSLCDVLETMADFQALPQKPFLKQEAHQAAVTGFIRMEGEQAICTIAIHFSESAILKIGSVMLQETLTVIDEGVADLVGEITNMVTGATKKILWDKGFGFELSRPEIFLQQSEYRHVLPHKVVVVPFQSDFGDFQIEACMKDIRKPAAWGKYSDHRQIV